jgi:hypothetical protein
MLHHDNAPAHIALSVRKFLASKQITVLAHPPYSPDLAPNDVFLFQKVKEIFKGSHFDDIDDIRSNTTAALKSTPRNQFQNCFEEAAILLITFRPISMKLLLKWHLEVQSFIFKRILRNKTNFISQLKFPTLLLNFFQSDSSNFWFPFLHNQKYRRFQSISLFSHVLARYSLQNVKEINIIIFLTFKTYETI